MELYFRAIMFCVFERKGNHQEKRKEGKYEAIYNLHRLDFVLSLETRVPERGRVRFLSRSLEARVFRKKSNQTMRNSSRNDSIIVWHCRLAVRIILSLSLIGTISHINHSPSDMQSN